MLWRLVLSGWVPGIAAAHIHYWGSAGSSRWCAAELELSSSSSCWICPFKFSVLSQIQTQAHGKGCCFLFPVIGGIESGSGQRHVGNSVYVHGFSYSCEFLVQLVHLELSLLTAGLTNGTFSSNTRFRSCSLHGSIYQLPQLCKV